MSRKNQPKQVEEVVEIKEETKDETVVELRLVQRMKVSLSVKKKLIGGLCIKPL